jgi:NADPH-dependent 2,4-dienoyl-CoA reductase/sulfur reductase-like enzyme
VTGRERTLGSIAKSNTPRRILVAGGGPAGMKAALPAAGRGHRVTLHEAGRRLGGQVLLAQLLPERAEFGGLVTNLQHELARAGVEVEREPRPVTVHRLHVDATEDADVFRIEVECSSGTYVRSLIADLGDAYCLELRRTGIGPFEVGDADRERMVPLDEALRFLPAVELAGDVARRASHGVAVEAGAPAPVGVVRLRDDAGLIALAEPRPGGLLKPVVGFRG